MADLINAPDATSTRPYLIRALYEWCTDNGLTPYVAVAVDDSVQVPREYVKNNEIVLNIGFDATSSLTLGNEFIEFKARFAGTAREILVPISHVIAIYARENGQGMAFPMEAASRETPADVELGRTETAAPPASTPDPSETPEARFMQLVPESIPDAGISENPDSPEPPPPSRPRPSLKRVK